MIAFRLLTYLLVLTLLAGCAASGINPSADPMREKTGAEQRLMQEQPLRAEKMIRDSIVNYQKNGDIFGLGNAHREYADLLLSPSVTARWQKFYSENGFTVKSVLIDNRKKKAKEYYIKSLIYYVRAESTLRKEKRYEALTQLYFNMGLSAYRLSTIDKDGATAFHAKKSILRTKSFLKPKRFYPGAEIAQQQTVE
ncbi:MAG: hypothetical protein R8M11_00410 [Gallionella sp.]